MKEDYDEDGRGGRQGKNSRRKNKSRVANIDEV